MSQHTGLPGTPPHPHTPYPTSTPAPPYLAQLKHALDLISQGHHVPRRIPRPRQLSLGAQRARLGRHHRRAVLHAQLSQRRLRGLQLGRQRGVVGAQGRRLCSGDGSRGSGCQQLEPQESGRHTGKRHPPRLHPPGRQQYRGCHAPDLNADSSCAAAHRRRRSLRAGVLSASRMPRRSIHTVRLPWPGAGVRPAGRGGQRCSSG